MDDLIKRLQFWADHPLPSDPERGAIFGKAATALAEAQAEIGRQQVMLDRALEASFDDKARADRMEKQTARLVPVIRALEAWYDVVRQGRTIDPSLMGLSDMIGVLSAVAGNHIARAALSPVAQDQGEG